MLTNIKPFINQDVTAGMVVSYVIRNIRKIKLPVYRYLCDNCEYSFDNHENFHDKRKVKCPECRKNKLYLDLSGVSAFVRQEPATVGQIADKNTRNMGKYEYEARVKEQEDKRIKKKKKEKSYKPWWRKEEKVDLKLGGMTKEQKKTYIETGKKPCS